MHHFGSGICIQIRWSTGSIFMTTRPATIIRFTATGWQFLRDAYQVKREIEAEYSAILGDEGMRVLRSLLTTLLEHDDQISRDGDAADIV